MPIDGSTSPTIKFFFSRIFPWLFVVVGSVTLFFGVRNVFRAAESINWPIIQGTVQNSSVEYQSSDKGGGTYHARIFYNYVLNGITYSGNRIAFGDYGSSDPSHAQEIVNRYSAGMKVMVHYMLANPTVCVLEPGIKVQIWFVPGLGLLFFLAGIAMALFLPRAFNKTYPPDQFDKPNPTPINL
jgi:hypothetical protein